LIYSATVRKLGSFDEVPADLKNQIDTRLKVYKSAPKCFLTNRNVTSWGYFLKNFDAYLQGAAFPLTDNDDSADVCG
jgi:Protein of unknown function (DUF1838)